MRSTISIVLLLAVTGGCYYPAKITPPPATQNRTTVARPYDLTWDAVHKVIANNRFKILGDDPNQGIVEAEAYSFSLSDADCGQMRSVGSPYEAEPDPGGSAVYNFKVEPAGPEASNLSINATYTTPLHVPLHPISDFQCVSRGTSEKRLLKEVDMTAQTEQRPKREVDLLHVPSPGRPTLLGPDILKHPDALGSPSRKNPPSSE